ncbi:SDR family NAD(P)-dependent oxidoreductase [Actinomadura sp. 1N219]|uniref:SDR family NAD(P)-dependent oxidoreductase n=1 Tax=Actinomadura sp. 1N219 TaxID=3375152 RepID=UPI0037A14288
MKESLLHGQVAIVTGAGAGLGRHYARLLAELGAAVVVNDVSAHASDVVREIERHGGRSTVSNHDVSDPVQAGEMVQTALDAFGGLHIVVSNAGVIDRTAFIDMDSAVFDRVMKVNAYGAFNVLRACWPVLVEQKYGRVVAVSSSSAFLPAAGIAHYAASKGAVLGLAKSLAMEGAEHGITVNVLAPSALTTMTAAGPSAHDEEALKRAEAMMSPRLVAPVVAWLVRPENALNGEVIEAAAGRAAMNFVGSTRGFWSPDLTVAELVEHSDTVFDLRDFAVLKDITELNAWLTTRTTGW